MLPNYEFLTDYWALVWSAAGTLLISLAFEWKERRGTTKT